MHLRVATLNVWALPAPFADRVSERMTAIGERLPDLDVDVMAFQEAWTPDARALLRAAGQRSGHQHTWHSGSSLLGSGLLVLSRLPIEAVSFERYALNGLPQRIRHADYYGGKGFARLRIGTEAGPLDLINTHLHARYRQHDYRYHRAGQVAQLAMSLLERPEAVVATGDFNFREGDVEYAILTGITGLRDAAAELGRRQPTVIRASPYRLRTGKPSRRIDFIFARDGGGVRLQPRSIERVFDEILELGGAPASYSNHAGVLAELEIEAGGGPPPSTPSAEALRLAIRLLGEGRGWAEERRRQQRTLAGAGIGGALIAAAGLRAPAITRRRLLRSSLQGAALLGLTPGLGYSLLSEVFVPDELEALEELSARLARLARGPQAGGFSA